MLSVFRYDPLPMMLDHSEIRVQLTGILVRFNSGRLENRYSMNTDKKLCRRMLESVKS